MLLLEFRLFRDHRGVRLGGVKLRLFRAPLRRYRLVPELSDEVGLASDVGSELGDGRGVKVFLRIRLRKKLDLPRDGFLVVSMLNP